MNEVLLLARLLLAAVFALAGLTKLADREGSTRSLVDFGVPRPLAPFLGVLLPVVELACALALVPAMTARWGAFGTLTLLVAFMLGISISLAKGRAPDCHCFGQLHSEPRR